MLSGEWGAFTPNTTIFDCTRSKSMLACGHKMGVTAKAGVRILMSLREYNADIEESIVDSVHCHPDVMHWDGHLSTVQMSCAEHVLPGQATSIDGAIHDNASLQASAHILAFWSHAKPRSDQKPGQLTLGSLAMACANLCAFS